MEDTADTLVRRIRDEFVEMPGLSLTESQAARLWHMPSDETQSVLRVLVDAHFLTRNSSGRYCRLSAV